MSTTNYVSLGYIEESTPGTTPAIPTFQDLPADSADISEEIVAAVSEAIRSDRMKDDLVVVDANVAGDCNFELSYAPWQAMIVALLQQGGTPDASVDLTETDISVDATTDKIESSTTNFVSEGIKAGQFIKVSGFTTADNNGVFRVASVLANEITVDTEFSDTLVTEAAGDSVTIKGDMYRNSNSTPKTYTFRKILPVDGTNFWFYYPGTIVNSMSFNWASGEIVKGVMNLVGRTGTGQASAIAGEETTLVPEYTIMSAASSVANIHYGLSATAIFSTLNLTVNNNVNPKKGIGTLGAMGHGSFDCDVSATGEMYFEDLDAYNAFKAGTGFLIALEMDAGSGKKLVISMPNCKFRELTQPIPGKNNFLMENCTIEGLRDSTLNCQVQFDFMS